jgi:hypothetical protein
MGEPNKVKVKAATILSADDLAYLRRFVAKPNHGRGRFSAQKSSLISRGFLYRTWLSRTEWCVMITSCGLAAVEAARLQKENDSLRKSLFELP